MYFLVAIFTIINPGPGLDEMPHFISYRTIYPHIQICKMMLPDAKITIEDALNARYPGMQFKHAEECVTKDQIEELNDRITAIKISEEKNKI